MVYFPVVDRRNTRPHAAGVAAYSRALNILTVGAARPAVATVPLFAWRGAPTCACGRQWIPFFVKFDRRVARVVIRAKLARVAPHAISTTRETIIYWFFVANWRVAVKTIDGGVCVKFWKCILHVDPLKLWQA